MKNEFEEILKNSLENHEMPYNPQAWKKMNSKLDRTPKFKSNRLNNWAYLAAASIVATIIIIAIDSSNKQQIGTKQKQVSSTTNSNTKIETELKNENLNKKTPHSDQSGIELENNQTSNGELIEPETTENGIENKESSDTDNSLISNLEFTLPVQSNSSFKPEVNQVNFPVLNNICQGEVIYIENPNDTELLLSTPTSEKTIKPNEKLKMIAFEDGVYILSCKNKSSEFIVKASPVVDFTINSDKYLDGVPTTKLECTVPFQSLQWAIGDSRYESRSTEAHFFKKGLHPIKLEVVGSNGCTASLTKNILIEEDFNLLATNSFDPSDNDPRVNTFLPYSLRVRNIPFHMIIIDPTDGHIVFESKSSNNPWDGIDITNGNLVTMHKSYIWKVIIEENFPGENQEYIGSVTPVNRR